jgi:hypothetical protein
MIMNRRPVFITGTIFVTAALAGGCFINGGWRGVVFVAAAGVIGFTFGWRAR